MITQDTKKIIDFIHQLNYEQLPEQVVEQAKFCLLDLLGVAVAGHETELSKIIGNFVGSQYPGDVPMLFSSQKASACGAALFGGMLIDSIDAHDGQVLTKGHVGVAILPGLLAAIEDHELNGKEFLTALVLGYEIATRAGIALHATTTDYHTSGAWNCIGVAGVTARIKGLSSEQTWEALGCAEFYGPRSQMMRCIDHPTMIKDGSGWGAMAGISSALLANAGFTGAPAITLSDPQVQSIWSDIGQRWYILEQYFKAYPVCRWAQPAVEAVRQLLVHPKFDVSQIREVHIYSFHEATRLHIVQPKTTEQAQYSLPFSVASALMEDVITPQAIAESKSGLFNPDRQTLSAKVITHEIDCYNDAFPAERWAHARIIMNNGNEFISDPTVARGNPENPLSRDELIEKYNTLVSSSLCNDVKNQICKQTLVLEKLLPTDFKSYLALLSTPVHITVINEGS
jgi:2-methylcitrate dehydratase PrpD